MSARMSREAAAQMHEFAVKAILATGVPMPHEAMTLPATSRAIVARVSNKKQKKNKQFNPNHLGHSQCCARFRRKVFCALNELGIPVPLPGEKPHEKFREFLRYTAPTSGDRARLLAFFNRGLPIDPSIALYWRLCHELGIDPDGSGFVYELKESVDIEAL